MAISLLVEIFITILLSPTITKTNATLADQTKCVEHEKTLLLELRNQLVFNSSYSTHLVLWNDETDDCCSWFGVECDGAGHVISLNLAYEGISGGLYDSSSLFGLKYLEELDLSYNANLSASLPDSISNLQRLSVLDLSHCKFSGVIPSTLSNLTQLFDLDLADNLFTGSISSIHFEALSNVSYVDLSYNSLSGAIPTSIFTLPSLWRLDLRHNQFSGQVSEFPIVNSSHQFSFLLSSNRLESPIPDSFFNLPSLVTLDLSDNLFNDSFRLQKILSFPNLTYLDLSNNDLSLDTTRVIPSSSNNFHVKQSSLHILDLSNNKIAGEVPSWIWEIGNGSLKYLNLSRNMLVDLQKPCNLPAALEVLDLHSNWLWGVLPLPPQRGQYVDYSDNYFDNFVPHTQSFSSSNLLFLSVANNSLSGPFPTFICNCTNLQVLDLSLNNLSGTIPACLFQNVTPLKVLNLGRNNLSGRIPDKISLGCDLRTLDLSHNNLVGDVPPSLQKCTRLAVMNVGKNHIEDNFPCMLPSTLQVLVLRSNRFYGEMRCNMMSWPNLQIIDIASNNFSGYLNTLNFSSWRGMTLDSEAELTRSNLGVAVDKSYYYYRDVVTLTIKGLELKLAKIWPEFTSIDFSCNNFHGDMPQAIGELNSLYLLNLSHNSLEGAIPESFSRLSQLGALDLSMNQLRGEIPQEIAGLTFLQMMNVSHNKLVGKIPVGTQIQSFSADCFQGNAGLCGLPLNITCTKDTSSSVASPPNVEYSDREEIEWNYVFGAAGYAVGLGIISWLLLFCPSFRDKYFEKVEDVVCKILDFCNTGSENMELPENR